MVFSLGAPATIERLLREARFHDVIVRTDSKALRLPGARDFLWQYVHSTPLAGMLSNLDPARLAALERDVVRGWQPWSGAGGMEYGQGMNVAQAHT
jgi:hypothetical protein